MLLGLHRVPQNGLQVLRLGAAGVTQEYLVVVALGPVPALPDEAVKQLDCVSEKGEATKWDLIKMMGNDAQFRK